MRAVRSSSAFLANGMTFQNRSPKIVIAAAPPNQSSYPSGHNQWWVWSMCSSSSAAAMRTLTRLTVPLPPRSSTSATARRTTSGSGRLPIVSSTTRLPTLATASSIVWRAAVRVASASASASAAPRRDAGVDLGQAFGTLGFELPAGGVDAARRLGPHLGELALVLRDLALGLGADVVGGLELAADLAVARLHALLHLGDQQQPHQGEEHEERAPSPQQLLALEPIGLGPSSGSSSPA